MEVEYGFDLRRAIDADRLDLHFQPRVRVAAASVIGAEALLRWSPDGIRWMGVQALGGLTAEEFGLLWRWKLARLGAVFHALRASGWAPTELEPGFFISLNLSQKQLSNDAWARELLGMIVQCGVPGSSIEVEITEQGAVFDYGAAAAALEMLRAAGVQIALDDFPEGGNSFLLLCRFPFDKVKIDRCMVPTHDEAVSIWLRKRRVLEDLLAIVARAGAVVVLEGVETSIQHRFLARLPIIEWQGYLWGKPMPLEKLLELLPFPGWNATAAQATLEGGEL